MSERPAGGSVVIAYDGSAEARHAIVSSAKVIGSCRVLVVTVWEEGLAYAGPMAPTEGLVASPMIEPSQALEVDRSLHARAERVSQEGAALARTVGLDAQPLAVADQGSIARTLLNLTRQEQAVAIVIGSRGLGGIGARLEGSTSKRLLKDSACPVIVVHKADEAHS